MRTFLVSASESKNLVKLVLVDKDAGGVLHMEAPFGPATTLTRDDAYALLKDAAAIQIRKRLHSEVAAKPECPHNCREGFLLDETSPQGLSPCPNPACIDYVHQVDTIGQVVDFQVAYNPGTHEDTSFPL